VRRAKLPRFVLSFCEIVTYRTRGLVSDSMQITFEKIPQEPAHSFEHGETPGDLVLDGQSIGVTSRISTGLRSKGEQRQSVRGPLTLCRRNGNQRLPIGVVEGRNVSASMKTNNHE